MTVHDLINHLRLYDGDLEAVRADFPQLTTPQIEAAIQY